jgi:hypothetical protein
VFGLSLVEVFLFMQTIKYREHMLLKKQLIGFIYQAKIRNLSVIRRRDLGYQTLTSDRSRPNKIFKETFLTWNHPRKTIFFDWNVRDHIYM